MSVDEGTFDFEVRKDFLQGASGALASNGEYDQDCPESVIIARVRAALDLASEEAKKLAPGREASLVATKIDEGRLWTERLNFWPSRTPSK